VPAYGDGSLGMQTYGGRFSRGPQLVRHYAAKAGISEDGAGTIPGETCCARPRSCAASPWVIERTTAILSAIAAVFIQMFRKMNAGKFGRNRGERTAIFDGREHLGIEGSCAADAAGEINLDD